MPLTPNIEQSVKDLEDILADGKQANPKLWEVSQFCIALGDVQIATSMPDTVIVTQARTSPNPTE